MLDADNNRLTRVSSSLGHCSSLTALRLASNSLSTIPTTVGKLTALTELDISGNIFAREFAWLYLLPASFAEMKFADIPPFVEQLGKLRDFRFDLTNLKEVTEEGEEIESSIVADAVDLGQAPDEVRHRRGHM